MNINESELDLEIKRAIKNMTLMDDIMMRNVFENKACVEYVLRIILGNKTLSVLHSNVQHTFTEIAARNIIMDVLATDDQNREYNIELQQENKGAIPKRARYHSSALDIKSLKKGEYFDKLPETYVIFITAGDPLCAGKMIYHIERVIKEMDDAAFDDKAHIIYCNTSVQDESELGRLMHDFRQISSENMADSVLKNTVKRLKETEEGEKKMNEELKEIMDKYAAQREKISRQEGMEKGMEKGRKGEKEEIARNMKKEKLDISLIEKITGLSRNVIISL